MRYDIVVVSESCVVVSCSASWRHKKAHVILLFVRILQYGAQMFVKYSRPVCSTCSGGNRVYSLVSFLPRVLLPTSLFLPCQLPAVSPPRCRLTAWLHHTAARQLPACSSLLSFSTSFIKSLLTCVRKLQNIRVGEPPSLIPDHIRLQQCLKLAQNAPL